MLKEQAADSKCKETPKKVVHPNLWYSYDAYGVLVKTAPINGALKIFVPVTLRVRLLYLCYYPHWPDTPEKDVCTTDATTYLLSIHGK